jgi:hypothetical protein
MKLLRIRSKKTQGLPSRRDEKGEKKRKRAGPTCAAEVEALKRGAMHAVAWRRSAETSGKRGPVSHEVINCVA